MQSDREGSQERSNYDAIFSEVFAPAVTAYVEWVLEQAARAGIGRLYFLARDGWLMYQAAQSLAASRGITTELRYLKTSRYSLRTAEYRLLGKDCLDTVCAGGINISFRTMMKRAALSDEEAWQIAELTGYGKRYRESLSYGEIRKVRSALAGTEQFFTYVREHAESCYEQTAGYLRQEGLMEDTPYAVVDSGWIGTVQLSLQRLVSAGMGREQELQGYYFGLYELPKGARRENYHSFYLAPGRNLCRKARFSVCLFEAVCSSPEGMTLSYVRHRGKYLPVESAGKNPNASRMRRNTELLEAYLEAYPAAARETGTAACRKLLRCMGTPSVTEARTLGTLLFCDDVLEQQMQSVAAAWDREELKKRRFVRRLLIRLGIDKATLCESGWPEGSIVLLGGRVKAALRQERMYKYCMYIRKAL